MNLHQSGNEIIVTELNPMSEAPRTGHIVQLFALELDSDDGNDSIPIYARWEYGLWQDIEEKGERYTDSEFIGWIPMPIYRPEAK